MGSRGESQPFYVYTITRTGAPFVNGFVNLSMSSDKYQALDPGLRTFQIKDLHPNTRWFCSDFLEGSTPDLWENDGILKSIFFEWVGEKPPTRLYT